jgi:hypothetical protein
MYNYHPIMSNEKMKNHTHTQYTSVLRGNQRGKKPQNVFSYMFGRITFIGSTNFLCFPVATGRRLQPPSFSGYNLREDTTPQFSSYNHKEATNRYVLWLQLIGRYNHLSLPHPTALK